jgi:glycosyltransferase involved in cell wall biosynthesis
VTASDRAGLRRDIKEFVCRRQPPPVSSPAARTRLSVVVPSYNQAAFVERTMNSIANQHYANLQLIVLDGGSSDGSQAVIERYSDIIHHYETGRDGGQAEAINKGFAIADGDFFAWQNTDDLYLPSFFHAVDEAVRAHPDTDLVIANCYVIGSDEEIMWASKYGPFSWEYLARVGWNLTSQSVFVRRDLVRKVGPLPNYRICFDFEWFLKVTRTARSILNLRCYGGANRIHPAAKLSTENRAERDRLEKRILHDIGLTVDPARSCAEQWPMRRAMLRARQRMHEFLLYPEDRLPLGAHISRAWAGLLNRSGSVLVGY